MIIFIKKKPLPPGVTHNHIIHITDSNKECEYLCNVLLNNSPSFFEDRVSHNIFITWHIPEPKKITIDFINIDHINAKTVRKNNLKITETPHYKYVSGHKTSYNEYYNKYCGVQLQDNHSTLQFDNLIKNFKPEQYNFEEKRLIIVNNNLKILDGLHRVCLLKKANITKIKVAIYR
jgi:hypothetical protein